VGRGRDNVGIWEWGVVDLSRDQARDVSHIYDQIATDSICDLPHALIVDCAAICRGTSDQNLGSVHESVLLKTIVVDDTSIEVDTVWEGLEIGGYSGDSV